MNAMQIIEQLKVPERENDKHILKHLILNKF